MKCPYRYFVKQVTESEDVVDEPYNKTMTVEEQVFEDCYEEECMCYEDGACMRQ